MRPRRQAVAIVSLLLLTVGMSMTAREPGQGMAWRLGFVACGVSAAVLAPWLAWRGRWTRRGMLVFAVMLRLIALPMSPTLSDDGYRYLWDGRVQAEQGVSPYRYAPEHPALRSLREETPWFERMNSTAYTSVYPPVSQAAFQTAYTIIGNSFKHKWIVYKIIVLSFELFGIALLSIILPLSGVAFYALHPLAVMEIAGQGHTEGLLIGALGLLVWSVCRGRSVVTGGATALAAGVKLWPVMLLPAVMRKGGRGVLVGGGLVGVIMIVDAGLEALRALASLSLYAGVFDFYSAPYLVLKAGLYPWLGEAGGRVAAWAMRVVGAMAVAGGALWLWRQAKSRRLILTSIGWAVLAVVLTQSVLHPWSLLSLLFVFPLLHNKHLKLFAVILTAGAILTYITYPLPELRPAVTYVAWGAAVSGLVFQHVWTKTNRDRGERSSCWRRLLSRRGHRKWERIQALAPDVRASLRVLDYGCAEGTVGQAAQEEGAWVAFADIAPGPLAGPVVRVSHDATPFASDAFDVTLLVFVLHHARDPEAVLREARRVTDDGGRVIVWESTPSTKFTAAVFERLDDMVNGIVRASPVEPSKTRPARSWEMLFERVGLCVESRTVFGRGHPQTLWSLSHFAPSEADSVCTAESTSSGVAVSASSHV